MDEILKVEGLKTSFMTSSGEVQAVRGVSFGVRKGEILGIVGESGSGKSVTSMTILRLVADTARIKEGAIRFEGKDLTKVSEKEMRAIRGQKIAMIFQDPMSSLNPLVPVGKQVAEIMKIHHPEMKPEQLKQRTLELFEQVRIPEAAKRLRSYPHEFSGGMRQRVMIAMALANRPDLLIADEPTTALDVTIQAQILKLMNDLKAQMGTSILFITHDLGVIHEMADEVAVMYCGQIVEKAPARTIFHDGTYSHPYTEGLMTSIPQLNTPKGEKLDAIPGSVPNPLYLPQGCKFGPRCKYCTKRCEEAEPPLQEVEPGHVVRCFYAEKAVRKEHGE